MSLRAGFEDTAPPPPGRRSQTYLAEPQRCLMMADAEHFIERGNAPKCLVHAVFQQCAHAKESRLPADGLGRLAVKGHLANAGVELHHFEDAFASAVAAVLAIGAATATQEVRGGGALGADARGSQLGSRGLVGFFTLWTNQPHQTLGHDRDNRRSDQERGTPISPRRVIALGASFVCNVLKTKCPVKEACTAISAVSLSRISPTRMIFGACRNMARMIRAKSSPIWCFTSTWLMPGT